MPNQIFESHPTGTFSTVIKDFGTHYVIQGGGRQLYVTDHEFVRSFISSFDGLNRFFRERMAVAAEKLRPALSDAENAEFVATDGDGVVLRRCLCQ